MIKEIIMPQVGQDIETAILREWLVKENDQVKTGDIVATVDSDKATFEVEAFDSGTVLKLLYNVEDEVPVLKPIAYIGDPGDVLDINKNDDKNNDIKEEKSQVIFTQEIENQKDELKSKVFITPSAKRAAKIHNVDFNHIKGSGPNGRIVKNDILSSLEMANTSKSESETYDGRFSKMRQKIADRMTFSKQNIPHFYLFSDLDLTDILQKRKDFIYEQNVKVSVNDIIIKVVADTLAQFPLLNSHVSQNDVKILKDINIGLAVSVDDGLLVPVIRDADKNNIEKIAATTQKISEDAKRGIVSETANATFTISNLGMYGISQFIPIINPPECAILGVGKVDKKIIPTDNTSFAIRDIMTVCLVCDHRGVDGVYGAKFLQGLQNNLLILDF